MTEATSLVALDKWPTHPRTVVLLWMEAPATAAEITPSLEVASDLEPPEEYFEPAPFSDVREGRDVARVETRVPGDHIPGGVDEFVERMKRDLTEDQDNAHLDGEAGPSQPAVETCLRLARSLAPHVALAPALKSGAFTEDDGGVSLVLHSGRQKRQLTIEIGADGKRATAIQIDERMRRVERAVHVDRRQWVPELARWLTSGS